MNIKRVRKSVLIFLTGMLIGLSTASLIKKTPKQAIISPVSLSLAETKDLIMPLSENQILGVQTENVETKQTNDPEQDKSSFFTLVDEAIKPEDEKIRVEEEKENIKQSDYQGQITVAVVGDSMTDLMKPGLPYLKTELKKHYPQAHFSLFNYGVGADNIENGMARIKGSYDYQGRSYSPLIETNPDIVVIESFAYNPFPEEDNLLLRHWQDLQDFVNYIKSSTEADIIILATIAPTKEKFGQGPNGVNWPIETAYQHAEKINSLLDNTVRFAQSKNLPLVDIYHQTLLDNGEGNPKYINSNDHIHQNEAGNQLIAKHLADKIVDLSLKIIF